MSNGDLRTLADGDANIPTVGPYLPGTLESRGGTPIDYDQVMQNGFDTFTQPILNGIAREMKAGVPLSGQLAGLDPAAIPALRGWLNEVDNAMASTKRTAVRMGDMKRDFSLLNYGERYGFDTAADLIFRRVRGRVVVDVNR